MISAISFFYLKFIKLLNKKKMVDKIDLLPMDELPPSNEEKEMIQWMYKKNIDPPKINCCIDEIKNTNQTNNIKLEINSLFIIFLILFIFFLPKFDSFFQSNIPIFTKIPYLYLILKSFVLSLILFFFMNRYYL